MTASDGDRRTSSKGEIFDILLLQIATVFSRVLSDFFTKAGIETVLP